MCDSSPCTMKERIAPQIEKPTLFSPGDTVTYREETCRTSPTKNGNERPSVCFETKNRSGIVVADTKENPCAVNTTLVRLIDNDRERFQSHYQCIPTRKLHVLESAIPTTRFRDEAPPMRGRGEPDA